MKVITTGCINCLQYDQQKAHMENLPVNCGTEDETITAFNKAPKV